MHGIKKHPCHAVLVQYGYDITSGERLNIGVLLVCHSLGFAGAQFTRKLNRISKAFPDADIQALRAIGKELESAARILSTNGQLAYDNVTKDARDFYYSVMPKMDSSILLSEPILGVTAEPAKTLASLYAQYVARFIDTDIRPMREDSDVWRTVATQLEQHQVNANRLTEKHVEGRHYEFTFQHAWKNGRWNAVQPLSFDLANPSGIVEKAAKWSGKMRALHLHDADVGVIILVGPPSHKDKRFLSAAAEGFALLDEELEGQAKVVSEANAESVAEQIARDLGAGSNSPMH